MLIREVATSVYKISLAWSNAYLLMADGVADLIDTGLRQDRDRLLAALAHVGIRSEGQLRAVYLTHGHCDHAGNAAYLAAQGAKLIVSRAEAPFLGLPRRTYAQAGAYMLLRPLSMLAFQIGEVAYPVERRDAESLLDHDDELPAPGGALRVVSCPGHTPGHIAYYRAHDGLLFSGDAILNIIPFRRVTGLSLPIRMLSDNWTQTKRSAQRLAELNPQTLLSGHGWPLTQDVAARVAAWANSLG